MCGILDGGMIQWRSESVFALGSGLISLSRRFSLEFLFDDNYKSVVRERAAVSLRVHPA
jgi:hypothetical protein